MARPIRRERDGLGVLERLDLRQEGAKDKVHEANGIGGVLMLVETEMAGEVLESLGPLFGIADGPQVDGEERLRPAVFGQ